MTKTIKENLVEQGFRKKIRRVGGSSGIIFNKEDIERHGLLIGKILNLDDAYIEEGVTEDGEELEKIEEEVNEESSDN